jgi:hypothetical protein
MLHFQHIMILCYDVSSPEPAHLCLYVLMPGDIRMRMSTRNCCAKLCLLYVVNENAVPHGSAVVVNSRLIARWQLALPLFPALHARTVFQAADMCSAADEVR